MSESAASEGLLSRVTAVALRFRLVRAFLLYSENRGPALADGVTYRALFGVFASVLLGFSVAGLWLAGNHEAWAALVNAVDTAIPGLLGPGGLVDPDDARLAVGFSLTGALSIAALVGAAVGVIGSLRAALHLLSGRPVEQAPWYLVLGVNLALAAGLGIAFAASAAVTFFANLGLSTVVAWAGLPEGSGLASLATRVVTVAVVFLLDAVTIAAAFRALSGLRPSARSLWGGALLGAVGLTALQELSGLFVRGATSNPLFASFASLIALLLWFNLSAQVILIASAYIITAVEEENDAARGGVPRTLSDRRVERAEIRVRIAEAERDRAIADRDRPAGRRRQRA